MHFDSNSGPNVILKLLMNRFVWKIDNPESIIEIFLLTIGHDTNLLCALRSFKLVIL